MKQIIFLAMTVASLFSYKVYSAECEGENPLKDMAKHVLYIQRRETSWFVGSNAQKPEKNEIFYNEYLKNLNEKSSKCPANTIIKERIAIAQAINEKVQTCLKQALERKLQEASISFNGDDIKNYLQEGGARPAYIEDTFILNIKKTESLKKDINKFLGMAINCDDVIFSNIWQAKTFTTSNVYFIDKNSQIQINTYLIYVTLLANVLSLTESENKKTMLDDYVEELRNDPRIEDSLKNHLIRAVEVMEEKVSKHDKAPSTNARPENLYSLSISLNSLQVK